MHDDKRLSLLCDMLCAHIVKGRVSKALLIAQYLRDHFGLVLNANFSYQTGHRS